MKKQINQKYVVGYCRYSSLGQREESIEGQVSAIERYAKDEGLVILKLYIDRAQTGTSSDRKEFQQMIADSKNKDFSQVLVYQLDRFSRDKDDHVLYKVALRKNGVRVVSVTEKFDDSPEGKLMESVVEGITAYTSHDIARKTTRGLKVNAEKARCNGSIPPYGFKRVPRLDENGLLVTTKKGLPLHDTVIHPEQAEAIKIIFNMTLEGFKRCDILDRLKELGYKKNDGKDFGGTNIDNYLRNERYTGVYIFHYDKKKWNYNPNEHVIRVDGGLPQIISKETFNAVQQILRQRVHRTPSNAEEEYLLSGKIYCGDCGTPYSGARSSKNGYKYVFYKCNWHSTYKNGKRVVDYCRNTSVRKEDLESYVIKQISKIIYNDSIIDEVQREYSEYASALKTNTSYIEVLEGQLKDIDKQTQNIINAIASGYFNESIQNKLNSLEEAKKKIENNILTESKSSNVILVSKDDLRRAYKKAQSLLERGTFEDKRAVLSMFLNKVLVFKSHVEIYTNLVPLALGGGIDLEVKREDFLAKLNNNSIVEDENNNNNTENTEKDGDKPSFPLDFDVSPLDNYHREKSFGASGRI